MAVTCYFDASGNTSQVVVAPAALIATPEQWVKFYSEWDECLRLHGVTMLHALHLASFKKEFKGWTETRRKKFLNHVMWIIEENTVYTAAAAVHIADYKRMDKVYKLSETMRPYTMGCLTAASSIVSWADGQGIDRNDIIWVFENGDQDQDDLRRRWRHVYPELAVEPIFLKKRDHYPDPARYRWQRPFEGADLVAYEHLLAHRLLDGGTVYEDEVSKTLQRMKNWPGADQWRICDGPGIERMCEKWRIKKR